MLLFERLRLISLKLQPDKCEYLRSELEYIGHLFTAEGIESNLVKIQAIRHFREPRNIVEVLWFLGLAEYYRKFIKKISVLAKPLTELIKKESIFDWTTDWHKAFDTLKQKLVEAPVLRYPN